MNKDYKIEMRMKLPVALKKDDHVGYIVSCPPLEVVTQGKNKKEALKNIKEAVVLFVMSCVERGAFDQVLKECGFKTEHSSVKRKASRVSGPLETINVPIPLLSSQQNNPQLACRA